MSWKWRPDSFTLSACHVTSLSSLTFYPFLFTSLEHSSTVCKSCIEAPASGVKQMHAGNMFLHTALMSKTEKEADTVIHASKSWAVIDRVCCKAIAVLIKGQTTALAVKAPVDCWTSSSHSHIAPPLLLIDKDSAAEWFSHMLTQADMLFHMTQPHSISPTLRGIVYDVCTPWS